MVMMVIIRTSHRADMEISEASGDFGPFGFGGYTGSYGGNGYGSDNLNGNDPTTVHLRAVS